jgi:DNA polymerase III subunit chi
MGLPVADICFYHNAPDPLRVACVLTAKAVSSGHRVSVLIPDGRRAQQFDYLLWSFQPLAFIPHVGAQSPLAAETPVVIATDARALPHQDVLINLGDQVPAGYERRRTGTPGRPQPLPPVQIPGTQPERPRSGPKEQP